MKNKKLLTKLLAAVLASALCIPVLFSSAIDVQASVSGNVPNPNVSGNVPGSTSNTDSKTANTTDNSSSVGTSVMQEIGKITIYSGGKTLRSTVGGVLISKSVSGFSASTPKLDLAAAAGISADEIKSGTNISFYICDCRDQKAKTALNDAAAISGKKVAAIINADLYSITKKGKVTAIRSTSSPVTMTFGLTGAVTKAGTPVSIMCIDENGKPVFFEDTDTDQKTVTIDANLFGKYAVVY